MELGGFFKNEEWSSTRVPPDQLATIIAHTFNKQITGRTAKQLLARKFDGETTSVEKIIADENLTLRPLSRKEYVDLAQQLIEEKPDLVIAIKEKQQVQKVKWFVGQIMSRSAEGTVEPGTAEDVVRELLHLPPAN